MTFYLELYHGHRDPSSTTADKWGKFGPIFGDIASVYAIADYLHLEFTNGKDALPFENGQIYYDGWWYSNWAVWANPAKIAADRLVVFKPELATPKDPVNKILYFFNGPYDGAYWSLPKTEKVPEQVRLPVIKQLIEISSADAPTDDYAAPEKVAVYSVELASENKYNCQFLHYDNVHPIELNSCKMLCARLMVEH